METCQIYSRARADALSQCDKWLEASSADTGRLLHDEDLLFPLVMYAHVCVRHGINFNGGPRFTFLAFALFTPFPVSTDSPLPAHPS